MSDRTATRIVGGLLAFMLLLALGAVRSSWTEDQAVGVHTEQQAAKGVHKEEAEGSLGPKVGEQAPSTDRQAAEKKGETGEDASEFWPPVFGYRFKVTDSLLVLFTAILAWKTAGLDAATRKLWEAGERQIGFAEKSSVAASDAAKAAIDALDIERPWMTFEDYRLMQFGSANIDGREVGPGMTICVLWKNYGRLPALEVSPIIRVKVIAIDDAVPFFPSEDFEGVPGFAIGPSKPVSTQQRGIDDFQFQAFRNRSVKIAIYSTVRYKRLGRPEFLHSEVCGELTYHAKAVKNHPEGLDFIAVFHPVGQQNTVS